MAHATYSIKNNVTGTIYFGRTKNITTRFDIHEYYLSVGRHSNKALQHDYDTYGPSAFEWSVLRKRQTKTDAEAYESELIMTNLGNVYNERKTGRTWKQPYNQYNPMLNRQQMMEILARKGTAFGYQIAAEFGISPSLVSIIFNNRYNPA